MRLLMWTGAGVAIVGVLFAAFVFAFLGFVLHGVFFVFEAILAGSVAGIACWWRREVRRAERAALATDDTELLDVDAIANHQPAPPRAHRFGAARWWRTAHRRASRTKEAAR